MMIGKRTSELRPGCRVRVRMKFGWGFTGELRRSDEEKIRVYDSTIDEVVRLDHGDVADISTIDEPSSARGRDGDAD
jgi:hypothetical protein